MEPNDQSGSAGSPGSPGSPGSDEGDKRAPATTTSPEPPRPQDPNPLRRIGRALIGNPRDFRDPRVFHTMSLVAFLAWVGLGADGLSSSAYGPEEAFRALGEHTYLAVFLALATALTVLVISASYNQVIEHFPHGGGGYAVATKLLGKHAGVVSGCALLVDYILTISISIASGADAIFSFLPLSWHGAKIPVECAMLIALIVLNLRGVKESITLLMPVFLLFVFTHLVLIVGGIASHLGRVPEVAHEVSSGLSHGLQTMGALSLFLLFGKAYSLGGGTYTGIEAVSNSLQIMREPRVQTGKRTMAYMAVSLACTAAGILLCYLLFQVHPAPGKTLNAVLADAFAGGFHPGGIPLGSAFVIVTLLSEGMLLFVAAQTGFVGGPRVVANLAVDSWLPHRFASLSDRLTTKDGVLLLGGAALAVLLFTHGSVGTLVVMYSINVFVTFLLAQAGMCRFWATSRARHPLWFRSILIPAAGALLCAAILVVTVFEKFTEGGWWTVVITSAMILVCLWIRAHYRSVQKKLRSLDHEFVHLPSSDHHGGEPDRFQPTAVLLVGGFGGIGIHSLLSIQKMFPNYFKNVVFLSVAVIDSGAFKGSEDLKELAESVQKNLDKYVDLARRLGWNADFATSTGIDASEEITKLCIDLAKKYPRTVFFAGKLIWKRESWWQRILHNETAYQVQRRLQWKGLPMTVIPLRVN